MNFGLLIIDMQKAFYVGSDKESMDHASEYINYTIELFRKNGNKIIWIQDEDKSDGVIRGTEGFEIIEGLKPLNYEKVIVKEYGNAFNKTDLQEYLLTNKITTIIITGYCAEYCVLSTYIGAKDNDITPIILKNAISSGNNEHIRFVEEITDTITVNILEKLLTNKL
jgi:nicotinamidase-related amidase